MMKKQCSKRQRQRSSALRWLYRWRPSGSSGTKETAAAGSSAAGSEAGSTGEAAGGEGGVRDQRSQWFRARIP